VWSYDPKSMLAVAYATGRASHAREVKDDDPNRLGVGRDTYKLTA
jgi:hypothetical protein